MHHRVLVTGANKGIGLAIVKGLLEQEVHVFVFLGCRDITRGLAAVKSLTDENASYKGRVEALQIDVSDTGSVNQAASSLRSRFADTTQTPLIALVNNAGIATPEYSAEFFARCFDVNVRGVMRTTDEFLPLLDQERGRVVMVSSGAGPVFVSGCSEGRQKLMTDAGVTLPQIMGLMDECLSVSSTAKEEEVAAKFAEAGLAKAEQFSGYFVTKALVNMYTIFFLAGEHPNLLVNACNPGYTVTDFSKAFTATDISKAVTAATNKKLVERGAKPPSEGAKAPIFLTTGDVAGSGWYFDSDCVRSPLDGFRSPGDPAYDG